MKPVKLLPLLALLAVLGVYKGNAAASSTAMTRGEFVAIISDYYNWVHWSEYNDYAKSVPGWFADVKMGDRYAREIGCALEAQIISPDENDNFYPNRPITRQDAAAIFARAFLIPPAANNALSAFKDAGSVSAADREALNALVADGYVKGVSATELQPAGTLDRAAATAILKAIAASRVAPVQAMPQPGTTSNRRNVDLTTPTPGATIYYTISDDRSGGPDPTAASKVFNPANGYPTLDNPMRSKTDFKYWTIKAFAAKKGLIASPVRSFVYVIYRPLRSPFQVRLVHAATATSPAVWDIFNPSDYNYPHEFYIEGSERGVVLDAGQYPLADGSNLKEFVDKLATKPYVAVLGHNHPDHSEQIDSFVQGGIPLYMTAQDKGFFIARAKERPDKAHAAENSLPVKDGDVFDLGNVKLYAYQMPGHENGLVMLDDKQDGWIFATDMFGPNRAATADLAAFSGVKVDLFLSLLEQQYVEFKKDGGKIVEVYNAHNEAPFNYAGVANFEKGYQELIDLGPSVIQPSMRGDSPGGQPMPNRRMVVVGDMWRDKNWTGMWVDGAYDGPVNYMTAAHPDYPCANAINYNAADGFKKYSVLSNIEIADGDLVGVDVSWAPPADGVANSLPNKFDPWTYAYDVKVPAANKSIVVTPTAMSGKITSIKLNGAAIQSGASHRVAVSDGAKIAIDVVAPDGVTKSRYVLTIRKS